MAIADELTKLGKEIESAKASVNQLEGRRNEILERLKKEFQVDGLAEAKELLADMVEDIRKLDVKINADFEDLKDNFSW